jgi:5-methylthioadenosine/S-adenosylhomocysteine deaminase
MNDVFSQIVHCAKASDVRSVMVNGEILMRDRRLVRHDDKRLLSDARQASRDLMERVSALKF